MLKSPRDLLMSTFRLYREQFWVFVGFAAWLIVPLAAFLIASTLPKHPLTTFILLITILAQLFVSLWIVVCIIRAVVGLQGKTPVDPNTISKKALQRIQPLLAVSLLQVLIVLGGILLLVIPAIIFWVWYSQAQVSSVIDNQRPIAALSQSRTLTRGRFFPVLWRLIAGPVVIGLGYAFVLGSILIIISTILSLDASLLFSENPPLWAQLVEAATDVFLIPLFIIYSTLLYQNLKKTPLDHAKQVA
jgi:hypothetical protein